MKFLSTPREFHQRLLLGIRSATQRVTLSALYVGVTKEREQELVEEIRAALADPSRPQLQVRLIIDHSRAHRESEQFLIIFRDLIAQFGDRVQVYLYELPSLRGMVPRLLPPQIREVLGVYHCKFMVFDGTAILTGANLSNDYYINRQDRYLIVDEDEEPGLVEFLSAFADVVTSDAHRLQLQGIRPNCGCPVRMAGQLRMLTAAFAPKLGSGSECLALIQCADLNLRGEQETLHALLQRTLRLPATLAPLSPDYALQHLSFVSPYPNFSDDLLAASCGSPESPALTIATAAPSSHGFANSSGVRKYIPYLHQAVLRQALLSAAPESELRDHVSLRFYARDGWTFHGKGLWFEGTVQAPATTPNPLHGCYIGSSNMSSRSHERDFELGFLFLRSGDRRSPFQSDLDNLARHFLPEVGSGVGETVQRGVPQVIAAPAALNGWERAMVNFFARIVKTFL